MARILLAAMAAATLAGCRPGPGPVSAPVPDVEPRTPERPAGLPTPPLVVGALAPRVSYPEPGQLIQSRDSNFILGSVGDGRASLTINGQPVRVWPNGAFLGYVANPAPTANPTYELVATLDGDTATLHLPVQVPGMPVPDSVRRALEQQPPPPPNVVTDTTPAYVILGDSVIVASDTDRVVIGRPGPNSVYRWFLIPGTRVPLTARYSGFARVRLDSALQIWVVSDDADRFATDTTRPRRVAGNARVRSDSAWSDLIIPVGSRPPLFVEELPDGFALTLYGTRGNTDQVNYPTRDPLIRLVEWEQVHSDRVVYTVRLSRAPFGYLVLFENGSLIFRVRRPPDVIGPGERPLAGVTVAVDAGHPPGGAVGPTGLREYEAALDVAFVLRRVLEERGARVFMTRVTNDPVDLYARPVMARQAGAHAFVSLHYNAYGDGVNPFRQPNGTEVYYYWPHSEPLARAIQTRVADYQPLPDQGVYFRSLAVVRGTWMPSVLVEGGFMMIPEQEYAMRTPEFQERYARAVADGLEEFFRSVRSR